MMQKYLDRGREFEWMEVNKVMIQYLKALQKTLDFWKIPVVTISSNCTVCREQGTNCWWIQTIPLVCAYLPIFSNGAGSFPPQSFFFLSNDHNIYPNE